MPFSVGSDRKVRLLFCCSLGLKTLSKRFDCSRLSASALDRQGLPPRLPWLIIPLSQSPSLIRGPLTASLVVTRCRSFVNIANAVPNLFWSTCSKTCGGASICEHNRESSGSITSQSSSFFASNRVAISDISAVQVTSGPASRSCTFSGVRLRKL